MSLDAAHLYLLDAGVYQLIKAVGMSEESIAYVTEHPMPLDRDTLIGRVGLDRRPSRSPDVVADPEYGRLDLQRVPASAPRWALPSSWTTRSSVRLPSGATR